MKKKHLLRSIIAIVLCVLMIGTAIAVGYTVYENAQGKKVVIDKDNNKPFVSGSASANVTTENGVTKEEVTLKSSDESILAVIPAGTKLNDGVNKVTLTVKEIKNGQANVELEENEEKSSYDVHVEGVATDNTTPIKVVVKEMLAKGLNIGNYKLYHVENGATVEMALLNGEVAHNSFEYDPATGDVTLYLASFSEVAVVEDTVNAWNGIVAENFASGTGTESDPYIIASADQFAYFSQIVSNDNDDKDDTNNFGDKHYKLIVDINFNGSKAQAEDNKSLVFYPVGYWAEGEGVNKAGEKWFTFGGAFKGVFDGNGHKISNIYQNTWLMDGDYDNGYWDAAMGIFGYVKGGTIKNLTVDSFSSDGEFTPTGVIAAYADGNSKFENIAITNCNPRVYNTGNGGIIGIAGDTRATNDDHIVLKNITVDQTNKISALWGSYDVACGGLVGMYRGNVDENGNPTGDTINFENCHIAAIMDVNNDVCANYQYYWYRYSGMLIGSIRKNTTEDNYTVADTTGITATNCTYELGDWNEYWYCELVANSIASYTHDHQFSRLTKIASVSEIQDKNGNWNVAGNFVIPNSGNTAATCYHIFKNANGELYQHFHDVADESNPNIYETFDLNGDGELNDLKEDRQCYFMPFNQVFNGYGYGVKAHYKFAGFEKAENGVVKSEIKFQSTGITNIDKDATVTIGDLFSLIINETKLSNSTVQVFVSPVGENSTVGATYSANVSDWELGTLKFTGEGTATITITDYFYCTPTTITVTISEPSSVDKFEGTNPSFNRVYEDADYVVKLGDVFTAIEKDNINSETVKVTVDNETICIYTPNASDWTLSTLTFKNAGSVTVTITDGDLCNEARSTVTVNDPDVVDGFKILFPNTEKYLYRVGNANTITLGTLFDGTEELAENPTVNIEFDTISGNVAGTYTSNATWKNGTIKFTGTGVVKITIDSNAFTNSLDLVVEVINGKNITDATSVNGTNAVLLKDVKVAAGNTATYYNCTLYGNGFTFDVRGGMNKYNSKQGHGIIIANNATIDNLVVIGDVYDKYGAYASDDLGNPLEDYTAAIDAIGCTIQNCYIANCSAPIRSRGDNKIVNTTLYGGTVGNLIIMSGVNTLENVTTVNYNDAERNIVGFGIVIVDTATADTKIVLEGTLKQYNFLGENDSSDVTDSNAKTLFDLMFNNAYSKFHFDVDGVTYVNTGILSLSSNFSDENIKDNANTGYTSHAVSYSGYNGYLYSLPSSGNSVDNNYIEANDGHKASVQGNFIPTFEFDLGDQAVTGEDTYLKGDKTGVDVRYFEGESALTLDITKLATVYKYGGVYYDVTASINGGSVSNGVVTFNQTGAFTLTFTVTDNIFYNSNGEQLTDKSVIWTFTVPVSVAIAAPEVKDAVITINNAAQSGSYSGLTDKTITFNPLNAITITDAEGTVNLTTNIASTNIVYASSSSAYAGATTITVTYNDGRVLTIVLGKPTLNSPGGSKAITYANDGTIKSAAAVASKSATGGTWTVTSYKFVGTNGKEIVNNTVVTFTFPDKSCVTGDTLVMLADGSQKRIDEVTYEDSLLVWNFFNGTYATVPASIIFYHGDDNYRIINLSFEDGTVVKIINTHGFYDVDVNEFVFIDEGNVEYFIGHNFVKVNGDSYTSVKLVDYTITEEFTGCYSIQSAQHNNFIVEGMFSETIPAYEGWFNYFEIGEGMKYDEVKMQEDIEKYGLYTYDDFSEYVTYEQFIAFNGPYLKVLVGKGVVTFEQILDLIATYVQ